MYKSLQNFKGVSIGDTVFGRCVTTNRIEEGVIIEIRHWVDEYSPRFTIKAKTGRTYVIHNAEKVQ